MIIEVLIAWLIMAAIAIAILYGVAFSVALYVIYRILVV